MVMMDRTSTCTASGVPGGEMREAMKVYAFYFGSGFPTLVVLYALSDYIGNSVELPLLFSRVNKRFNYHM